ncbi:PD-(D/E)XK motif protein [Rhodoluna limnophila]|uniref:PD-(D/E)XK motif protein n=1 Tax=Rhodoluna limnophila TaxID=232537 RepID=UPI00110632DB|nr:PD-(D/E)XK motif protein [Rhodoluna limnophila]
MSWTIEEVVRSLTAEFAITGDENSVSLPMFDKSLGIGIGVDGAGALTLVLPGLENQTAFETKAMKFEPWCETTWVEQSEKLPRCAVLRCKLDRGDKQLEQLVVGVLLSLVDLQVRFNDAGHAIWALKELFGEGFKVSVQMSVIRGLIGELLVIYSADQPSRAVSAWHVDVDDRYDFSVNHSRIEVKTSISSVRQHRFTSRQLPPLHSIEVWVASVQLAEVAVGENIGSLFNLIAEKLPLEEARKLAEVVVETLGVPASAVVEPHFDLQSSLDSIRLFPANSVPTPVITPGTSGLEWTAYVDEADGIGLGQLNQLLNDGGTA